MNPQPSDDRQVPLTLIDVTEAGKYVVNIASQMNVTGITPIGRPILVTLEDDGSRSGEYLEDVVRRTLPCQANAYSCSAPGWTLEELLPKGLYKKIVAESDRPGEWKFLAVQYYKIT